MLQYRALSACLMIAALRRRCQDGNHAVGSNNGIPPVIGTVPRFPNGSI
jgi:hypothetical protein